MAVAAEWDVLKVLLCVIRVTVSQSDEQLKVPYVL